MRPSVQGVTPGELLLPSQVHELPGQGIGGESPAYRETRANPPTSSTAGHRCMLVALQATGRVPRHLLDEEPAGAGAGSAR